MGRLCWAGCMEGFLPVNGFESPLLPFFPPRERKRRKNPFFFLQFGRMDSWLVGAFLFAFLLLQGRSDEKWTGRNNRKKMNKNGQKRNPRRTHACIRKRNIFLNGNVVSFLVLFGRNVLRNSSIVFQWGSKKRQSFHSRSVVTWNMRGGEASKERFR